MKHPTTRHIFFTVIGVIAQWVLGNNAFADDLKPIGPELNAKSAEVATGYPEANAGIEAGIKALAESGIVEKAPKVGEKAPSFTLPDAASKSVSLDALLKRGPVVITWYRGGWCPYCNIALHGLVQAEPQIRKLGATLVAITPETPKHAEETILAHHLTFPVLSDHGNKVAHQYRLAYKLPDATDGVMKAFKLDLKEINGDDSNELPLAAAFVVDKNHVIRYAFVDADYRKRAEPAAIIEALKQLDH